MKPMSEDLEERRQRLAEALGELRGRAENGLGVGAGARWALPLLGLAVGIAAALALRVWWRRERLELASDPEAESGSRLRGDRPDPDDPYSDLDHWYQGEGRRDF